jgi:uncharacterized membrane protein YsdA (DUF1294 family)
LLVRIILSPIGPGSNLLLAGNENLINTTIVVYLVLINLLAFGFWGVDKTLARLVQTTGGRKDRGGRSSVRRIPEKWLLALALLGGCWGCWIGVLLFRHKLRKPAVLWSLFGFSLLNLVLIAYLISIHAM